MHTRCSTSLTSTFVLALSAQLLACATDESVADDETSLGSPALARTSTSAQADADVLVRGSTSGMGVITTAPVDLTPAQATSSSTSDLQSNHPWVVDVGGTGGLNCRGVLIHPSWVLTAAHCIGPYPGTVSYTRTDPASGAVSQDSRAMNASGPKRGMFVHPDYQFDTGFGQPKNDIALVRLASPFNIDRNIQTVGLPRFYANPGRTGTIVTHNHGGALAAGYTAVVRAPQLAAAQCPAPAGFLCVSPAAGSLCEGDSGSGFVEILDGRAQLVGVASNMSSDGSSCVPAGGQVQLTDVFAYRDWILGTMGMSADQVAGRVRLRWSGFSSPSTLSLQCLSADLPPIEVPASAPGGEIAMDCDDARVFCQAQGANTSLSGFSLRSFTNGSASVQALSYTSGWTAAFGDPGASFLEYTCAFSKFGLITPVTSAGGVLSAKL